MVKKSVSRSEFARMAGVSAAAVTKATSTVLKEACDGKRIDASHPAAKKYLKSKTPQRPEKSDSAPRTPRGAEAKLISRKKASAKKAAAKKAPIKKSPAPDKKPPPAEKPEKKPAAKKSSPKIHDPNEHLLHFMDFTLRDIIEQFGTELAFLDFLKATKHIEDINEKRLKNAQTEGTLVSRELVLAGIIEPVESAHVKLLGDGSRTIATEVAELLKAGKSPEEIEQAVSRKITSFIRPVKAKTRKALEQ